MRTALSFLAFLLAAWSMGQAQTITITMKSMDDGGQQLFYFESGSSRYLTPPSVGGKKPSLAVKAGDTLVFVNGTGVYCKPFSYSKGNRFDFGRAGIAPGESRSYTVKGSAGQPVILNIRDEMHNRIVPMDIAVLPSKSSSLVGKTASKASKGMVKGLKSGPFTGLWETSYGKLKLTQAGNAVGGSSDYYSTKVQGTIKGDGKMYFTWSDSNKKHGGGVFELGSGGDSFNGTWWYILSDGKTKGLGGGWSGKRIK